MATSSGIDLLLPTSAVLLAQGVVWLFEQASQPDANPQGQSRSEGARHSGDSEHYYAQELFQTEELTGYIKNMLDAEKSVHEQVVYDLGGERSFAEQLEGNTAVKVYAKLPGWFKVPTPLGAYEPDWAVLIEIDGIERLYFVVETKPSLMFGFDLRGKEQSKIDCGKAHFAALADGENPAKYVVATNLDDVFAHTG